MILKKNFICFKVSLHGSGTVRTGRGKTGTGAIWADALWGPLDWKVANIMLGNHIFLASGDDSLWNRCIIGHSRPFGRKPGCTERLIPRVKHLRKFVPKNTIFLPKTPLTDTQRKYFNSLESYAARQLSARHFQKSKGNMGLMRRKSVVSALQSTLLKFARRNFKEPTWAYKPCIPTRSPLSTKSSLQLQFSLFQPNQHSLS